MSIGLTGLQVIELLALFSIKHLVVDFFLQTRYQWSNKGTYGHPGGILHSGLHLASTWLLLCLYLGIPAFGIAFLLAVVEFQVHYHVDWAKMNINARMGWKPDTSEMFWWLLGVDQFLHLATYGWIVWVLI